MPRRKGHHGISPAKRAAAHSKDDGLARKKAADSNEDPGGGRVPQPPQMVPSPAVSKTSESVDINSKYLHKKFKKMATTMETEQLSGEVVTVNGACLKVGSYSESTTEELSGTRLLETETSVGKTPGGTGSSRETTSPGVPTSTASSQGRYVCPYCKLACAKPSVLQKHIRAHTNERPYPCHPCGFAFKTKSNLYKHCRSRAHALKMEEEGSSGSKFNFPSAESSEDVEDDEDENTSNNTPPPSSSAAPHSGSSSLLSSTASSTGGERPRQIYKPKFHKAALYQEEEEKEAASAKPRPASPPPLSFPFSNVKNPASPTPEFIQRHISKIISENQAIVETSDAQWPKKFQQRQNNREQLREGSPASPLSAASSPGLDGGPMWPKKYFHRQMSLGAQMENVETERNRLSVQQSVQSKLALALLRPTSSPRTCDSPLSTVSTTPEPISAYQQPLNLSTNHVHSKSSSESSTDINLFGHRKRSYSESFGNISRNQVPVTNLMTVLKDHNILTANNNISPNKYRGQPNSKFQSINSTTALLDGFAGIKNNSKDKLLFHPQNPEGSIIKDLLLKARAGVSVTAPAGVYNAAVADILSGTESGSYLSSVDEASSSTAQYVCSQCNIPYRNAETFEIHQLYYCQGDKSVMSPMHSPLNYVSEMQSQGEDSKGSTVSSVHSMSGSKGQIKFNKSDLKLSKENSSKPTTLVVPPFPSPGPLLGSTPLVDSYHQVHQQRRRKESESEDLDDLSRRGSSLPKKRRLDSDMTSRDTSSSTSPDIRSLSTTPISGIIIPTTSTTTLRSLEELSKCPMRSNSLQMFGGEVQILDGAGEMKTMRIEPSSRGGKSPGGSTDLLLSLPNHLGPVLISSTGNNSLGNENTTDSVCGNVSPHIVVTIARSGLHSGGTIVQKSSGTSNVASGGVVKPPRSSGGTINCINVPATKTSPIHLQKPLQKNSGNGGGMILNSPSHSPLPYTTSALLSSNTNTITNTFPDTAKILVPIVPNIATPNLAVPGIPAPNLGHHLPFMSYASILPDGTLLNPLTHITAYNPLTLPPQSSILQPSLHNLQSMKLTQPTTKEKKSANSTETTKENHVIPPYSGGVVTILHGGKAIPYVPGMPGPHTLISTVPSPSTSKKHASPKPLDLASPSKESFVTLKVPEPVKTPTRPTTPLVSKSTKIQMFPPSSTCTNPVSTTSSSHQEEQPSKPIPSIKVDCPASSSCNEEFSKKSSVPKSPSVVRKNSKGGPRPDVFIMKESEEDIKVEDDDKVKNKTDSGTGNEIKPNKPKFLRPTSLPLKPGTFTPKKYHGTGLTPTGLVLSLVSPETPRPKKSYGQLYLNGHAYTYLGLKCSTRAFYCTLNRPQPMYVTQSPDHPKLSMYSNWKVCLEADPNPFGLDPGQAMALYDSRHRPTSFTIARPSEKQPMVLTHSSYWLNRDKEKKEDVSEKTKEAEIKTEETELQSEPPPRRVKIFDGGFESNEDYIYVRGRGRGRYVCEECGIRCKKPSMLKKHIRTHTDVRPFTCKHCNFSFKTKGNLTKHMKSKAHYKKCVELGIVPVPTVVDDSYIDEESLARQQALRASHPSEVDSDSDENDDDEDEDDDEEDEEEEESLHIAEDGEDNGSTKGKLEREAACSLLSLSESTRVNALSTHHQYISAGLIPISAQSGRPNTYPYSLSLPLPGPNGLGSSVSAPQTPTLTAVSAQTEREKVSRNTGLVRTGTELDFKEEEGSTLRRRGNAAALVLIPPQGDANRYYFPSCRTPTIATSVPVRTSTDSDSDTSDENSFILNTDDENSEIEKVPTRKTSVSSYDKVDTSDGNSSSSQQPMDLSNKNLVTRKLSTSAMPYFPPAMPLNGARTPTTPISEILTPVSEPATLLASLCSSMERFPVVNSMMAQKCLTPDPAEATMLQAYLTERALQDVRMKQHQYHHHHNHHTYTTPEPRTVLLRIPSSMKETSPLKVSQLPNEQLPPVHMQRPVDPPTQQDLKVSKASHESPEKLKSQALADGMSSKLALVNSTAGNNVVRNVVVGSLAFSTQPSSPPLSPNKLKAEFLPPSSGPSPSYVSMTEDGRSICVICNKIFSKPSQLRLHVNIHYFERPFRCESCAVSFRTKGHLQKHERSVSHQNKVSMNSTFGTPTTTNPRPFKCDDCKIAFRIHGHLAKHLRSKMHIMKLECVGKLPFGTYAEMEREGISLNEIDTTDCENSLESLQVLAQKLYEKDPSKLGQWDSERGEILPPHPLPALSGGETSSDEGEPLLGYHSPHHKPHQDESELKEENSVKSVGYLHSNVSKPYVPHQNTGSVISKAPFTIHDQQSELRVNREELNRANKDSQPEGASDGDSEGGLKRQIPCPLCHQLFPNLGSLQVHSFVEHDSSTDTKEEDCRHSRNTFTQRLNNSLLHSSETNFIVHGSKRPPAGSNKDSIILGQVQKRPKLDADIKQLGNFKQTVLPDQVVSSASSVVTVVSRTSDEEGRKSGCDNISLPDQCQTSKSCLEVSKSETRDESAKPCEKELGVCVDTMKLNCDLCGKLQPSQESLQKHLLSHAQPRPFVCEFCDAGFISQQQLCTHLEMHQQQ